MVSVTGADAVGVAVEAGVPAEAPLDELQPHRAIHRIDTMIFLFIRSPSGETITIIHGRG